MLDVGMLIGDRFEQGKGVEVARTEKKSQVRKGDIVLIGVWKGMRRHDLTGIGFGWISLDFPPLLSLSFSVFQSVK